MHFLLTINSDISVLIVCNKTGGGTIKGDIKKNLDTCERSGSGGKHGGKERGIALDSWHEMSVKNTSAKYICR